MTTCSGNSASRDAAFGSTLIVRVDAGIEMGAGHVMRCLALAQAWQDAGGTVVFLSAQLPSNLKSRLHSEGVSIRQLAAAPGSYADAHETAATAAELKAEWLLVDGFHFDESFLSILCAGEVPVILIDDHGARSAYDSEIVLNPMFFAAPEMYRRRAAGKILAGPEYCLLRREFRRLINTVRPERSRLLVTMGGSDPNNVTLQVLTALNQIEEPVEITILSGGVNPHRASLERAVLESKHPARLLIDVADMPALFSSMDMAISAPGGTCFELAVMHIPMLLVTIAENHERTAQEFAARGLAASVGWYDQLTIGELAESIRAFITDAPARPAMAHKASSLIDGRGAERVIAAMLASSVKAAI